MKNDNIAFKYQLIFDYIEKLETEICHSLDIDLGHDMIKPLEVLKDNVMESERAAFNDYIRHLRSIKEEAAAVIAANSKESA